jgi:Domain of unknown function (DUF4440)/Protein of unknown function (DUF1579)
MRTLGELLAAWGDAEARGDAAALGPLLAADFRGDGPLGSVLDKEQWLDRHRRGDLTVDSFGWRADEVRVFGRTAVATGTQSQVARYRGRDCSGAFACTLVAVRHQAGWRLVNLQLGPDPGHLADVPRRPRRQARGPAGTRRRDHAMASNESQPEQLPGPDPALKAFDRFIGTWDMKGRTLDSEVENVSGRATYEWLPGGYFVQQRIELNFAGYDVKGLELIGYDPETGTFPSTAYSNASPAPLPYRWDVHGDELKITTEVLGATFRGRWSEDGSSFSGGWRPDPGREGPGNVAYDIWGSRAPAAR